MTYSLMFFFTPTEDLLSKIHKELQIWICSRYYERISEKYVPNTFLTNKSLIKQNVFLTNQFYQKLVKSKNLVKVLY